MLLFFRELKTFNWGKVSKYSIRKIGNVVIQTLRCKRRGVHRKFNLVILIHFIFYKNF